MTFSVLLPTRDRLTFLSHAVESVRRQDDEDWELVVSDNNSAEDIAGFVAALDDDRVRYVRTESFVPVTDNWNNALAHATGDYLIMLGDDDALLPGYFTAMRGLIERFDQPDALYTGALLYAYPGVMPGEPHGYLHDYGYAPFLRDYAEPHLVAAETRRQMVEAAMDFRVRYGFNMQFALLSRRIIDEIAATGSFYRSPFPDYFAMNTVFLRARSLVADPQPRVVIGVTPKSYGFFHVQGREAEARGLLNNVVEPREAGALEHVLMPGTNMNTGWLLAMEAVRAEAGPSCGLTPNHRRYRRLQIAYTYEHHADGTVSDEQLAQLEARLTRWERAAYGTAGALARLSRRALPRRLWAAARYAFSRVLRQTPSWNPKREPGRYDTIIDVFDRYDS